MNTKSQSIYLVGGTDEFSIKEAAAKLAEKLAPKSGGEFAVEIIEGTAGNQDEALKILGRVNEALGTVSLFGDDKLVWLKSTNLLADERGVMAEAVKEALTELADSLKRGLPDGVRLLISAVGCDRRKTIYKTIEKLGTVQFFEALEEGKQADEDIAEFVQRRLTDEKKELTLAGFQVFRELVAPNLREIANELEKLCLYVGSRVEITDADVRAICSASRQAVIWELTDSLGARSLRRSLHALDNLLGNGEAPMGIIAMLSAQFRFMLLTKDLMTRKLVAANENAGFQFVKAFEGLPAEATAHIPKTKEGKLPSPWRLYRCALAAKNFSTSELIDAMDLLLQANLQLVSTRLDERLVLEQALVKIAGNQPTKTGGVR
ncbi:MAG: DNA polymerase III subunit delta [Verrucomicrobiota bacterium]